MWSRWSISAGSGSLLPAVTTCVVAFTRYSPLPWLLTFLHQRKYNSFASAVPAYGLLLSALQFGQHLAMIFIAPAGDARLQGSPFSFSCYSAVFMLLTGSSIAVCFVTRYVYMVLLYIIIGMASSSLLLRQPQHFHLSSRMPQLLRQVTEKEASMQLEQSLAYFAFSVLVAGYLYDSAPLVQVPQYAIALLLASLCIVIVGSYYASTVMLQQRGGAGCMPCVAAAKRSANSPAAVGRSNSKNDPGGEVCTDLQYEEYNGKVPSNFLSMCSGDQLKAERLFGKMLHWRRQYRVDEMLSPLANADTQLEAAVEVLLPPKFPFNHFHTILQYYPHAIHGYALDGCAVVYEILGRGQPRALKAAGVEMDDLVWHFTLRNELVFERLLDESVKQQAQMSPPGALAAIDLALPSTAERSERPVRRMMTVLDVGGISISSVTSDVISFIKKSGEFVDNYYPEQVARLVICNAPRWFSTIWTVIARVLPESVQKKIDILYDCKGLDKYIHPSQRPVLYGGSSPIELGQAPGHLEFLRLEQSFQRLYQHHERQQPDRGANSDRSIGAVDNHKETAAKPSTLFRWLPQWSSSAANAKPRANEAFLGEKNSYRYDAATGVWTLDVDLFHRNTGSNGPTAATLEGGGQDAHTARGSTQSAPAISPGGAMEDGYVTAEEEIGTGDSLLRSKTSGSSGFVKNSRNLGKRRLSKEELEEHGLVLAIQAAHLAAKFNRTDGSSVMVGGGDDAMLTDDVETRMIMRSFSGAAGERPNDTAITTSSALATPGTAIAVDALKDDRMGFTGRASEGISVDSSALVGKLSAYVFLLVVALHLITSFVQSCLFTLLPVWMVIPLSAGGLDYGVKDVALVLSGAALLVLVLRTILEARTEHILKASPVRSLRIGCGILLFTALLIPRLLAHHRLVAPLLEEAVAGGLPFAAQALQSRDTTLHVKVFNAPPFEASRPLSYSTLSSSDHHNIAYDAALLSVSRSLRLPSHSLSAAVLPSALLALLVCGLYLCRRSSAMLLQLTLQRTFQSPTALYRAVTLFLETLGPMMATLLFSVVYGLRLKAPLDGSFVFAQSAVLILLVYMGSVPLKVQFRGDYGVMTDYQESHVINQQVPEQQIFHGAKTGGRSRAAAGNGLHLRSVSSTNALSSSRSNFSTSSYITAASNGGEQSALQEVASIPLADLNLLCTPTGSSYGTKLHNLKDDFKEV